MLYECPRCGRTVDAPPGLYYCRVCGPGHSLVPSTELEHVRRGRNTLISRLALALAAHRCMYLPREEYRRCIREEVEKARGEVAEAVDKMIEKGEIEKLRELMELMEVY
jgi:hypothetical protein